MKRILSISKGRDLEDGEIAEEESMPKEAAYQSVGKNLRTAHKKDSNANSVLKVQKEFKTPKKSSLANSAPLPNTRLLPSTKPKSMNSTPTSHKIDMLAGLLDDKPPTRIEVPNITRKRVLVKAEEKEVKSRHPLDDIGFQLDLLAHYVDNW